MGAIIVIGVILLALAGSSKGEPGGTGDLPGGGKKPIKPTGPNKPGGGNKPTPGTLPPKPDPFLVPGSGEWGDGVLPEWFDTKLNHLWVAPNCDYVAEGALFETSQDFMVNAVEAGTLVDTLKLSDPGMPVGHNSVYGFLDYLVMYEDFSTADELALRVLMEANPLCADLPPDQWPEPLKLWFADFTARISAYMDVPTIGFE